MASAFFAPGARPDSAAASREAVFSLAGLPVNTSSSRWTPTELSVSVTQAHAAHRKSAHHACSSAVGSVPRMAHKGRAHSTFVPGCVLRRPAGTFIKQVPCLPEAHKTLHVPAAHPAVSTAAHQAPVLTASQRHRRPSLQLPAPLPNGIPLRRTTNSCFEHYKILEPVGAGTYANVWKVQRLPISRLYNNVPLTTAQFLSSPKGQGTLTPLSDSPYQCHCKNAFSVEESNSAFATVLPRKTSGKHGPSTTYVQKKCQQQRPACGSSSITKGRIASDPSSLFKGREEHSSRGPTEGQVYAAKLLQLDRFSADTLPRVLDMFSKEIVNLAACQCPGVVGLHEVVEGKEGWLLVQDFVDGGTIWCEDVCRDEDEAFLHFIQVLQAVLYLQENSVLHRDLKPTNILRSKQSRRVVIADFGWSERLDCCHITPMEWPGAVEQRSSAIGAALRSGYALLQAVSTGADIQLIIPRDLSVEMGRLPTHHAKPSCVLPLTCEYLWRTLEINPPEIINGTGPLTDRLDNYAVGMTLLLFLSGRFVCRQKGLDAATAAPYVLRTVHELRQGPPPAVFKGSGEAWALFIGLTAPHPFRRWSLDHVLAHTWVQQKLLRLRKQAFIWHPRVLQLAIGLQRAHGHSLYAGDPGNLLSSRLHGARGGCSTTHASRCSFESLVKMLPGGHAVRGAVLWTPNRYLAGTVSSSSATTHTLPSGRELSTAAAAQWTAAAEWTAAAAAVAVEAHGGPCGNASCAGGGSCEQCCRMSGFFAGEWDGGRSEGETQVRHLAQRPDQLSPLKNASVSSSKVTPPSPSPCTPQHVSSKGLYSERGSSCSRRQSLSICSTTDSFVTNLSFQQQQQASQQSARGQGCVQTSSSLLTPNSHVERAMAEGADWQLLLPRSAPKKSTDSLDDAASQDARQASILRRSETYANNGVVPSIERVQRYQHGRHLRGMDVFNHYLHYNACESTETTQGIKNTEFCAPSSFATANSSCARCYDLSTPVPQFLLRYRERQIGSLTSLQQQRPLPWRLLLSGLVTGGEADFEGVVQETGAGLNAIEHSMTTPLTREARAAGHREPQSSLTLSNIDEAQKQLAALDSYTGGQAVDDNPAASPDPRRASAMHPNNLQTPKNSWMQSAASGKARLLRCHPYTRQQGSFAHPYARKSASQYNVETPPTRSGLAPLDETSVEDDDDDDGVHSSWAVLPPCELSVDTVDPITYEGIVDKRELSRRRHALPPGKAATVPFSHSAGSASFEGQASLRRSTENAWHYGDPPFWDPHRPSDICNTLEYNKHAVPTPSTSTWCGAALDGQVSAFTPRCTVRDPDGVARPSFTKLPLQRKMQQLHSVSASVSVTRIAYQALLKPSSAALSFPVAVSQRCAATHRSASIPPHYRRRGGSMTAAHSRNGTLLTGEESADKPVYTALPRKLAHASMSSSLADSAILTADEEERVEQLFTPLRGGKHGVPLAQSQADAPVLSRTHAMQRLPSQLSTLSSENGCESAAVLTRRRPSSEVDSAGASPGQVCPALHPCLPSPQLHASQIVGRVTEKARQLRRDSLSSPAATFPATPSITNGSATVEPACGGAAFQRKDCDLYSSGTQQDWTSTTTPNALLGLEGACLAGVCLEARSEQERGNRATKQRCTTECENAAAMTTQLLHKAATSAVPPAPPGVSRRSRHSPAAQEAETAYIDPDLSSAGGNSGGAVQAGGSSTEQRDQQDQRKSHGSVNDDEIFSKKEQQLFPYIQCQVHERKSSNCDNKRHQNGEASVDVTKHATAFQGGNTSEMVSTLWQGRDAMPRSTDDQCKQPSTEAACQNSREKCEGETSPELQTKEREISSKLEKAVETSGSQQLTSPAVEPIDTFRFARHESKSAAVSDLPTVAGCVTHCAGSSVNNQQVALTGRVGCSGPSCEEAQGAHTSPLPRGNHLGSRNNMKITGKIEFHGKRHSPRSSRFSLPSFSCESGERLSARRGQVWRSGTPTCQRKCRAEEEFCESLTSGKCSLPDGSSRQSLDLRAIEDGITERIAISQQRIPSIRRRDAPSPTGFAQETFSCLTNCHSFAGRTTRSECLMEPHAPGIAAEASEMRRATATESSLAATAKTKCVDLRNCGTGNSVACTSASEADGKLCGRTENLRSSKTHMACRQCSVSAGATRVCSPHAPLRRTEHRNQQLHDEDFFYRAASMTCVRKYRTNSQNEKGLALPWQRAASFPATMTTTRTRRMHNIIAQDETIFLCGQDRPRRKPRISSCALLGTTYDDNGSAALLTFEFRSEPLAIQSHPSD